MSEKRKKAQTESAPKKNTNTNYSRIENICLVFAVTFLILFIGGYYIHNEPMTFLGLGIGFAGMVIQLHLNFSEDN